MERLGAEQLRFHRPHVKKVALIQMDFAVRDSRIPGTGWIFGTFQYNGAVSGKPGWQNLVPVGVM
ncbi:hypothetical protein GGR66_003231 [Xanthomonas sp. 3498]|nr:hypothetical protein [Xanthomonas sp. 3498]